MRKTRSSRACKALAWIMLPVLVLIGTIYTLLGGSAMPYAMVEPEQWQSTGDFWHLMYERDRWVLDAAVAKDALQTEGLSYVEQRQWANQLEQLEEELASSVTNYRFQVKSADGKTVLTSNLPKGETLEKSVEKVWYATFVKDEWELVLYDTEFDYWSEQGMYDQAVAENTLGTLYVIESGVASEPLLDDGFGRLYRQVIGAQGQLLKNGIASAACLGTVVLWLLYILWSAGYRPGEERPGAAWQDRIFLEGYLALAGLALILPVVMWAELWNELVYRVVNLHQPLLADYAGRLVVLGISAGTAAIAVICAMVLRTLAVRLRTHTLSRSILLSRAVLWLWNSGKEFASGLPTTWKTLALCGGYLLITLIFYSYGRYNGFWCFLWFAASAVGVLYLCWWAMAFCRLRQGGKALAAGNLNHQIDTHKMPADLKGHGEDLNNISAGLSAAVEEQMKSERFKAELITNVSHDLKTPLTTIINYVSLLKTTQQSDPKALEYIEVLDRKSQRLKKLTEDLVEASKASTGVLKVEREKLGMSQLIDQALGEWEEKLADKRLSVVKSLPEGETYVYADGRHLWRVIDNLLSNCAKYALEGTRVYLELTRGHGQVTLSVKNISREALNIPPERLMERFVRGEESRSTEGSGLGLSIARSLTELQGGTFSLSVDGDLFKASIELSLAS